MPRDRRMAIFLSGELLPAKTGPSTNTAVARGLEAMNALHIIKRTCPHAYVEGYALHMLGEDMHTQML